MNLPPAPTSTRRRLHVLDEGHHPAYVVWELTLRCDHACTHCGSRAAVARDVELTTTQALDVVRRLAELGAALESALVDLPPELAAPVRLRQFEGLSWSEIATRLGEDNPDTVRFRHARALTKLARRLGDRGNDLA